MDPVPPDSARRPAWAELLLLLVLAGALFFSGLGQAPLWDDDETRFASVARAMLGSGDWVVPRFHGELADKPPLLFWAIAASFRLFGETNGAARLPSVLFALLAVAVTWETARRLFDGRIAWWSGLALATSLLFSAEARLATTDSMLLALVASAMLIGAGQWWRHGASFRCGPIGRAAAFGIGAVCGLGVLVKGPAALFLPVLTLWLFVWWMQPVPAEGSFLQPGPILREGGKSLLAMRPLAIMAGVLLIVLPWHALVWHEAGGDWFRIFYLQHYAGRLAWLEPLTGEAMQPVQGHRGFPFFQVVSLLGGFFPWSVFLPLAVWRMFREAIVRRWNGQPHPGARLLLLWLMVWLVVVSFSSTQLPHYVFPAYPAAAIMVAVLLVRAVRNPDVVACGWLYAAAGGLAFGGIVLAAVPVIATGAGVLPWMPGLMLIGLVPVASACIYALLVHADRRRCAAAIFGCSAVALCAVVFRFAAPSVGLLNPMQDMIRSADAAAGGHARLAAWRTSMPMVVWHAGRPVRFCTSADEVATFLKTGPDACAFVDASSYEAVCEVLGTNARIIRRGQPLLRKGEAVLIAAPRG